MEFYSAMKKNEIFLFLSKWTELENIILSKVSQAQKSAWLKKEKKKETSLGFQITLSYNI
jgi:hypothetical protein